MKMESNKITILDFSQYRITPQNHSREKKLFVFRQISSKIAKPWASQKYKITSNSSILKKMESNEITIPNFLQYSNYRITSQNHN